MQGASKDTTRCHVMGIMGIVVLLLFVPVPKNWSHDLGSVCLGYCVRRQSLPRRVCHQSQSYSDF